MPPVAAAAAQAAAADPWAHGHALFLVPIGNAAGLAVALALATALRLRWPSRLLGVVLAAAAGFLASAALPSVATAFFASGPGSFLAGFLPPAVVGGGFLLWRRSVERRS
ncbi:MAG: hypothetical protein QM704_05225 [Anaeromyxobacteraceae bacterium]